MFNFKETDKGVLIIYGKLSKKKYKIKCDNINRIWLMCIKNLENDMFHVKWIQDEYNLSRYNISFKATNWKGKLNYIINLFKK